MVDGKMINDVKLDEFFTFVLNISTHTSHLSLVLAVCILRIVSSSWMSADKLSPLHIKYSMGYKLC